MIPHFDIQGHAVSVDWPVRNTTVLEVDVNTTASWKFIVGGDQSYDCFILKDKIDSSGLTDESEDDDDPLFSDTRKCMQIAAERIPWFFEKWNFYKTACEVFVFDSVSVVLLLLSIVIAHFIAKRISRDHVVGVVRVSYTDPNRAPEYTALPSSKFSPSSLAEEKIIKMLLEQPGFSSFTVVTAHPIYLF
jgi:hypothetical protein